MLMIKIVRFIVVFFKPRIRHTTFTLVNDGLRDSDETY